LSAVVEHIRRNTRGSVLADITCRLEQHVQADVKASGVLVFTGARHAADLAYMLGLFPKHAVVLVHADASVRFDRSIARGRQGDPRDLLAFMKADMEEHMHGLAEVIADFADRVVDNSGDLPAFEVAVRLCLDEVAGRAARHVGE
jgi:dephospho-CoA kinase